MDWFLYDNGPVMKEFIGKTQGNLKGSLTCSVDSIITGVNDDVRILKSSPFIDTINLIKQRVC